MRLIITLLLLIPSLSWGLTFKDGKQVGSNSLDFGKNQMNWKISCSVEEGSITQDQDYLIFKTSENLCEKTKDTGGTFNQRSEIYAKDLSPREKATYEFETYFSVSSQSTEPFQILSIHDGRDGCNPPFSLYIDSDGKLFIRSAYKYGKGEQCLDNPMGRGKSKANIQRDGTEYKVNVIVEFFGNGNFYTEVYLNDNLDIKGTYETPKNTNKPVKKCQFKPGTNHLECEEKIYKYEISKKFYFKHGVYSKNIFDYEFKSKMNLKKIN